jgi:predicted ATPase
VRMGLHTGEGRLGGDNYAGLDVNRAARIAAAGHGGQVVLSEATRALVAHQLPAGAALRDLGEHRLRDLPAAERLWQLEIEGLPQDFPALRMPDAHPDNLPSPATPLIGREDELAAVADGLERRRLVTLTGPGGGGKTRLALAAAEQQVTAFKDGAFFVPLEDAHDRLAVTAGIATALGVREKPGRGLEESVNAFLRERELLLVLDNFEQVLDAAPLVAELMTEAPRLRVMVTSRATLHLSGEQEVPVPPLRVPDPRDLPPLAALSQYESVALFIERARSVRPDFAVTNQSAPAVAEICSRLDGLPLAIELAAAGVKLLSPQAILARLERRLPLAAAGARDVPDRQRTLRGAIDWSFELLDEAEQRLFTRLAVFAGGWSLDAAVEVCNPDDELGIDTFSGLASLADKSLIHADQTDDPEPRFGILQVIREFAAGQLDASTDGPVVRTRHARRMLAVAEEAEPQLVLSDVRVWQSRLRRDEDNLRTALRWARAQGEAEIGLRIAGALWRFWQYWAELNEGRGWLEAVLQLPGADEATLHRAKALSGLAALLYWQGEADRAASLYGEALAIYRASGDDRLIAEALYNSAWAAVARGDPPGAMEHASKALDHYQRAGDRAGAAIVSAWLRTGPYLMGAGGSAEDALAAAREAIDANREQGRISDAADWTGAIAQISYFGGDYERAGEAVRDVLRGFHEIGNVGLYPMTFRFLAALELATAGDPVRAVRLAAASHRYVEELGGELPMMVRFGDPLEEARPLLSAEEHARAVEEGRTMPLDEVVGYALDES